jgi:PAS domain S-box-containing protein
MLSPVKALRSFLSGLGPVEQAQIVASTAVVVSMATIISVMAATGVQPRFMDFVSIVTVGVFGIASVYFSLLNNRRLDEQRRQLLALNAIAEAVNRVVDLNDVLRTALTRITEVLNTPYAWIYIDEGDALALRCAEGSNIDILALVEHAPRAPRLWLNQPRAERERRADRSGRIPETLKQQGVQFWTSMPLRTKDTIAGVLVVAGPSYEMLTPKQAELAEAFGNHISVAIHNARLFERVQQSEQRYADLFENAPDIYLSVNRQHIIVGCNRHGATLLETTPAQIIGKGFSTLCATDRQANVDAMLLQMFTEGRALKDVEEPMVTLGGRTFFVLLNTTMVFDETGRTVTARIVARDITERKRMEDALLHAQKIDSIGNLAGGIAHDFNNILAAILGSASIMRRHISERNKLAKYVEIIESSARRGSSLTRQLLTFARKTETITAPVDINSLVQETLDLYQRSVSKDIVVRTNLADTALTVNGDDGQIQQSLLNLFLNARDAMGGAGTLTVTTQPITADTLTGSRFSATRPGPFVEIRITDTGRGIPKDIQDRIFEPFFTTKDNGTGLGLSVVYGVIQNHKGFINLESEEGVGTTFTIALPHTAGIQPEARKRKPRLPHGSEHILVVDDEAHLCEIARDILTNLGYTVYIANNGREGVDFYKTRQASIDLVLLDINMPVMSGIEAFDLLRAVNPNLRVIIVSGYGKGIIDTPRFASEVNGFVQKPFQLETLAFKVRKVLDQRTFQQDPTVIP